MQSRLASRLVDVDWQSKKGGELAQCLSAIFTQVRDEAAWRFDRDDYHWGLYEGDPSGGSLSVTSRRNMTYLNATLPDNVCKMGVDTLTAKVATIRPIPQVLTSRGNYKDQRKARKLRQFIQGEFFQQKVHEKLAPKIIKDALVARGGVVHVYTEGAKIKVDRVHPWTLFVDDWDAEHGEPTTMFRLRTMDRRKAVDKVAKTKAQKEAIRSASYFSSSVSRMRDEERSSTVERVELLEVWYRCQDHDPDDEEHECTGRHVIMCEGSGDDCVLLDEPWTINGFPFAVLTYDTPNTGFWGSGLVQTGEGYQYSINRANEKLGEMYDQSGVAVILRDGSGVFKEDITNGLRVMHCRPGPYEPKTFDIDLVNEHTRMRPVELTERCLNSFGVSQMAAQSKKPQGVDAGVALQTLDDIESQRHIVFGRAFESWCMDVARLLVECVKRIAEEYGDYETKVPMKGAYLPLKWKDVEIDGFQLEMQSVGQLFTSFAGRLDKLKTLFEMGAIDTATFMRHLDAGDLQSELDLETVDRLIVDEMIEAMLDAPEVANDNDPDADYISPSGYLPLEWAHRRAHLRRLQAEMDGAPERVLRLLTRFIDDLQYLMDKNKATAMTPEGGPVDPMAAPPMPPGPPMPPPPPGGPPLDPMMPQALAPSGDQLMTPGPGGMPPMAA